MNAHQLVVLAICAIVFYGCWLMIAHGRARSRRLRRIVDLWERLEQANQREVKNITAKAVRR